MTGDLFHRLETALGIEQFDASVNPPAVAPGDIASLAETMRIVSSEKGRVVIAGGGTLSGPRVTEDAVNVSLARLSGIREVNPGDFLVVAGAGTVVDDAVSAARNEQLLLPLDITSAGRATVGGAYMTSAVGPCAAGYGPFRDFVLGAECVTATGEVVHFGGRTMKNVTGYEITRFLAGSRGIFAVAAQLTLKALPLPERRAVVTGRFTGAGDVSGIGNAVRDISGVKSCELIAESGLGGGMIAGIAVEAMDAVAGRGIAAVRESLERAGVESVTVDSPESFRELRRNAARNLVRPGMLTVQVPAPATAAMLQWLRTVSGEMPLIVHPLLGRIHLVTGECDPTAVRDRALAVGGKIPVVWGEGIAGRFTPAERDVIRSLKRELDPGKVLNPHLEVE